MMPQNTLGFNGGEKSLMYCTVYSLQYATTSGTSERLFFPLISLWTNLEVDVIHTYVARLAEDKGKAAQLESLQSEILLQPFL